MKFLKTNENTNRYVDNIFSVVNAAKADEKAINATAGCLYDEQGKLYTFRCVFDAEKNITPAQKAAYAASPAGNKPYLDFLLKFVLEDRVINHRGIVASAGGTGAIFMAVKTCLEDGDTIIYPTIAWGNYRVIADENNLNVLAYDPYDLDDMFKRIDEVEGKVFLIVNSPCQNPLGLSYTLNEWERIMDKINSLDKEVILLRDIAYIDYANGDPKSYFKLFNNIKDNVLILMAVSCSKAFSYYGQRLGALIVINNDPQFIDLYTNLASRLARTTWSNLNNAGMINVAAVLSDHYGEYRKELSEAKKMLKDRVELFVRQAEECGLELYKFSDGFFVTLKMPSNEQRDIYHQKLIDNHIYTIKVNKGIRLGLCSVPLKTIDGLAAKMKGLQ